MSFPNSLRLKTTKNANTKIFSAFVCDKGANLNNRTINATMMQFTKVLEKCKLIQLHIAYRQVTRVQGRPHILPNILVRVSKTKSGTLLFNLSKRSKTIFLEKFDKKTGTHLVMNLLSICP